MRRLYLKIVVSIWVVMIVSSIGAATVMRMINAEESESRVRAFNVERFLMPAAVAVIEQASGKSEIELITLFDTSRLALRKTAFSLRDANGNPLLNKGPEHVLNVIDEPGSDDKTWRHDFIHGGNSYSLIVVPRDRQRRGPPFPFARPGYGFLMILGIAIPISVLLSILLARYLIRPLKSFELAGVRLADGDLSARISPSISNRGDELGEFASTFDHMAERIELLVNSHKDLLRDVSHELRSPLARLQASLSIARQRTGGAVDAEMDRIELEVERLDDLIGKLLALSRIDSKQVPIERELVNIDWVLADVIVDALVEATAEEKNVVLTESCELKVLGDAALLASCFENIIRNAIRHTPRGSTVEVSMFVFEDDSSRCCVSVRDRGDGLPEEELTAIFELFRKAEAQDGRDSGNSGIGLAIADKIVSHHGGDISAHNASDGGLIISVCLPVTNSSS
ncbi:MAG: HAMP domain-containing protein [Gammaproteobacteria bacterium]|nr:HAMP domain-containing protein [Gammaproteobacteria bacterium]